MVLSSAAASAALVPVPHDLSSLNTFGLRSHAQAYVRLASPADVQALGARSPDGAPLLVLGGGSNVVLPARVGGLVAHMALLGIRLIEENAEARVVEAAAGENWHEFVAYCVRQGWGGLENLALIPGTVGAAPVQNVGAYGVEIKDRFAGLTAYDLERKVWVEMSPEACAFAYRDSIFKREPGRWVVTAVRFRLPLEWKPVLDYPDLQRYPGLSPDTATPLAICDAVSAIRRAKLPDPAVIGNAGSFFKNPVVDQACHERLQAAFPGLVSYAQPDGRRKLAAGWLIDQCGWKGRSLGPVGVHDRQALVLVNRGGATADDVLALADAIRRDVRARYGVELEMEPVVAAAAPGA